MTYHTTWGTTTKPVPGHKSLYGKAYIRQGDVITADCEYNTVQELYSYGAKVAAIHMHPYSGPLVIIGRPYLFGATTGRHFTSLGGTPMTSPTVSRISARRGRAMTTRWAAG